MVLSFEPSIMDGVMAGAANDQCLPPSCGHDLDPDGFLSSPRLSQVCEFTDVVDLTVLPRSADLTGVREEPFNQLVAICLQIDGAVVDEDGLLLASERYASKPRDQWFLAGAFHAYLKTLHQSVR